jgi:hypothetical protein
VVGMLRNRGLWSKPHGILLYDGTMKLLGDKALLSSGVNDYLPTCQVVCLFGISSLRIYRRMIAADKVDKPRRKDNPENDSLLLVQGSHLWAVLVLRMSGVGGSDYEQGISLSG